MSRLLFANYYSWFDMSTWSAGIVADQPLQPYVSSDRAVMERHVTQAKGAGIDALNLAWLGPANPTDVNLATLLPIASARGSSVTAGFETDSPFFHSRRDIRIALRYLLATYTARPGYLRIDGRPVIFFWRLRAIPLDGAANPLEAWRAVRDDVDPNHQAIWIAEGDRFEYLDVFDGIYPYSIAWASDVDRIDRLYASRTRQQAEQLGARKLWVATVMPGYDDRKTDRADAFSRDRAGGAFFDESWRAAVATDPDWIMITSWNEWVEGSQIEPSRSYGDRYLNSNRSHAFGWKTVAPAMLAFTAPPPPPPMVEEEPPPAPEVGPHLLSGEILQLLETPAEASPAEASPEEETMPAEGGELLLGEDTEGPLAETPKPETPAALAESEELLALGGLLVE